MANAAAAPSGTHFRSTARNVVRAFLGKSEKPQNRQSLAPKYIVSLQVLPCSCAPFLYIFLLMACSPGSQGMRPEPRIQAARANPGRIIPWEQTLQTYRFESQMKLTLPTVGDSATVGISEPSSTIYSVGYNNNVITSFLRIVETGIGNSKRVSYKRRSPVVVESTTSIFSIACHPRHPRAILVHSNGPASEPALLFDTQKNQVTGTFGAIAPVTNYMQFQFSPDGTRLYACRGDAIDVYDGTTYLFAKTIPMPGDTGYQVTFLPNGTKAYASNTLSGAMAVINVATDEYLAPVKQAHAFSGIGATHDSLEIYAPGEGEIWVLDTLTDTVRTKLAGGLYSNVSTAPRHPRALAINVVDVALVETIDTISNKVIHRQLNESAVSTAIDQFGIGYIANLDEKITVLFDPAM